MSGTGAPQTSLFPVDPQIPRKAPADGGMLATPPEPPPVEEVPLEAQAGYEEFGEASETFHAPTLGLDDATLREALNEPQYDAVTAGEGPLLILAGAGSGKTRVITYRIASLIARGVKPYRIMALTFTNKAAGEMKERAGALLRRGKLDVWIATFHSACMRILRRDAERLGYSKDFTVYDALDQGRLIKTCVKELMLDEKAKTNQPKAVASFISRFKSKMQGPDEAAKELNIHQHGDFLKIFALYQRKLAESRCMDFDDLLGKTVTLFRQNSDVKDYYRERFQHLLVDEFQDTNKVQYELIHHLAGPARNVCVVGDDDQSIYLWRGANVGNFSTFEKDFPGARIIKLEQNYRSTRNILSAAHAVVERNSGRKEKKLWTDNQRGEKVRLYTATDEMDEAAFVAGEIRRLKKEEGRSLDDFAIFYRTNSQSRSLEDQMRREGFPYQIFGGLKFYARAEVKDLLAYFRAALNPNDNVALHRVINTPPRGIGATTVTRLEEAASREGLSLMRLLDELESVDNINAGTRKKLENFREIMVMVRAIMTTKPLGEAVSAVMKITGYLDWLAEDKTGKGEARMENLEELVSAAEDFVMVNEKPTMADFLDQAALVADADGVDEGAGTVKLMTVHVSKGLEFPVVFVTGLEDNIFPHARSKENPDQMEEERRLLYVAMTRARERLYMIHADDRRLFGVSQQMYPSPFLRDLPEDVTEKESRPESDHDARSASYGAGYGAPRTKKGGHGSVTAFRPSAAKSSTRYAGPKKNATKTGAPKSDGEFTVGDKVVHPSFGVGAIRNIEGSGDKSRLTIYFPKAGQKKLVKKFARLTMA